MSTDLEVAFARLERTMGEQLGVKFQITRDPNSQAIGVTARFHASKSVTVPEPDFAKVKDLGTALIDACIEAKLALCSDVQTRLMNMGRDYDRDDARLIHDSVMRYRLACIEVSASWERLNKTPAASAAAEYANREHERFVSAARQRKEEMLKIIHANYGGVEL